MSSTHTFFRIPDKKQDLETIAELINITNIGIEAIAQIYENRCLDKNNSSKTLFLQENLIYRIFAALHQYELLIDGLNSKSLVDLNLDPFDGDLQAHPTIYRYSCQLSSIVDSIFFHLCSVFDYLGHFISYMFEKNKDKTLDWGSLAKKARAAYKETLKSAARIQDVDAKIRTKLDKYRSELIHRNRDLHHVGITINQKSNQLYLTFSASPESIKQFKSIVPGYDKESQYTLEFLPSLVFYQSLQSISYLLDYLRIDLLFNSAFEENVESNGFLHMLHPVTNKPYPKSEVIWSEYRRKLDKFYLDFERGKNGLSV